MNNVKPNRISNGLLVLLFALVAFPVAAQDSGLAYIPNANKPGGSWVKFTDGQSYKKVLSPAAYGGAITGTIDALATNPSGNQVALKYTAGASSAAVGAAVGKFASKVVAPLAVGVALYDLGKELGYILDTSSGQLVVQKPSVTPAGCGSPPAHIQPYFSSDPAVGCHGQYSGVVIVIDSVVNAPPLLPYHLPLLKRHLYWGYHRLCKHRHHFARPAFDLAKLPRRCNCKNLLA